MNILPKEIYSDALRGARNKLKAAKVNIDSIRPSKKSEKLEKYVVDVLFTVKWRKDVSK